MRSTFSILYYINRSKVKGDGTTAIMCRITIDGKSLRVFNWLLLQPRRLESQDRRGKKYKNKQPSW